MLNQLKYLVFFISSSLLLVSCSESRESKLKKISDLENKFYAADQILPNDTTSNTLVEMYAAFAHNFPSDTLAPIFLFKAGEINNGTHKFEKSLECFKQLCEKYPNHAKAPYAWFFRGFISENMLADSSSARKFYDTFLQKYPQHHLAHDVSFALKNLGRNSLDIVHEFEKVNQDSAAKKIN